MDQKDQSVSALLDEIVEAFRAVLGDTLVGIYLHGSLAMGCFNPALSDVDFLVVVRAPLDVATKQKLIDLLLEFNERAPAKGIEMSVVTLQYTQHFVYPTPYELHFSNTWVERYKAGTTSLNKEATDSDLAAHFVITKTRGKVLYGLPVDEVFADVPTQYYQDSIEGDAREILRDVRSNPVYNILNLCRVWAYRAEGLILSKQEGGEWALGQPDAPEPALVGQALDQYIGSMSANKSWDQVALERFGAALAGKLSP